MRTILWVGALVACGGTDGEGKGTGTPAGVPPGAATGSGTGVATGTGTGTATGAAVDPTLSCTAQPDNALRFDCEATLPSAAAVTVSWEERGSGEVRTVDLGTGTSLMFTVYGVPEQATIDVTATTPAGGSGTLELTTGTLPVQLQQVPVMTGVASFDQLLFEHPCTTQTHIVMMDRQGRVIWYQPFAAGVMSNTWTNQDTLLTLNMSEIVEYDAAGREILRLEDGVDFTGPVHHDVFRTDSGLTYALFADSYDFTGTDYVLDGFYVFDQSGARIATWESADHIVPIRDDVGGQFWSFRWPGAVDYTHSNSIFVEADGTTWISMRWLQSVLRVDGDPSSPTFGALQKTLAGNSEAPDPGDYLMSAPPGIYDDFQSQHDATPHPGGVLTMFDNREIGNSRGLALQLDDGAGTAVVVEHWDVGQRCNARGSTKLLPSGNAIVTCATDQTVMEFAPGGTNPVWTMQLTCPTAVMLGEAQPISL